MKAHNRKPQVGVLALAVEAALVAMSAMPACAAEDESTGLKMPTNYVEVGAWYTSDSSAKFGEYTGLDDSGLDLIGNFSLSGGDAYGDGSGATRWTVKGTDLGLTSRNLGATISNQGQWSLGVGYDELRHNISDTYQTPQQGKMGGNNFTFPSDFGTINAQSSPSARVLDATYQVPAFHTRDVHTDRKNTSFNAGYNLTPQLSLQFDYNHLDQDGAKLLGTGALGGISAYGTTWRAEGNNVIMNPTNYKTDTFSLALNWIGDKGYMTGSYYGSIFRDGYDSLSLQNAFLSNGGTPCAAGGSCTYQTIVMSTAPDNSFHQLNLTGGYAFSSATKLSGGLSYGRNTQDNSFLTGQPEIALSPRASLDGKVITTHADLKLTHQANKDLALSAVFKYNERENQSPSNIYQYYAINNVSGVDYAANAPYSNRKTQFEMAGDYRVSKGQNVRLSYEHESIKRWCEHYAIDDANCLVNPGNDEDKLSVNYRLKVREDLSFKAGYTYGKRSADFEGNAITPLAGLDTATPDDVNAQNFPGFVAFPYAKRNQHLFKAGVNWQVSDRVDLGLNGRYSQDDYDATLGVQNGHTAGINLDATYAYSEKGSISAYASWMNRERKLKSGCSSTSATNPCRDTTPADNTASSYDLLIAPDNIWTNLLKDDSNAIGLNVKHGGLMGGKLEIVGDLSYSLDKSQYSTQVPFDQRAAPIDCNDPSSLICGALPDIKNEVFTFKLTGTYQVDKTSKVAVGYLYQKRNSDDYYYNGYQYQYTPNRIMPTNELAPNYEVNVVAVSYIYNFK